LELELGSLLELGTDSVLEKEWQLESGRDLESEKESLLELV
jgi:hypothetical protein